MRFTSLIAIFTAVVFALSGCGGGGDSGLTQVQAIAKIVKYISTEGDSTPPSPGDYEIAGIAGVTDSNIDDINNYAKRLDGNDDLSDIQDALNNPLMLADSDDNGIPDGIQEDNLEPTATSQEISIGENSFKIITLSGIDNNGDTLTYTITDQPDHGALLGTMPNIAYKPDLGYNGSDSFTFSVNDDRGGSDTATVSINIANIATGSTAPIVEELTDGTYDISLGGTPSDVYILLSNHSETDNDTTTSISHNAKSIASSNPKRTTKTIRTKSPKVLHAPTKISNFNRSIKLPSIGANSKISKKQSTLKPTKREDVVGNTKTFYLEADTSRSIRATARKVVSNIPTAFGNKTLNVWVSNDSFGAGCGKDECVTQEMVNALADNFLKSGLDNDIYDWVTNIYGEEWGSAAQAKYSNLIGADDEITILLTDIDNDNSSDGGVIGFFYGKDNYDNTSYSGSNNRVMFYADSVMFANKAGGDDDSWSIDDPWPMEMISTLAHEFQHMIHFYQRTTLRLANGESTKDWIDELLSETTEDIVATRFGHQGPRAVDHTDGSAGSPNNPNGRYPLFNGSNTVSLPTWTNTFADYSKVSSFGTYLIRNYGGAKLLHNIMHNDYTDKASIIHAVNKSTNDAGKTFDDLLREWGVAVLLSDVVNPYDVNDIRLPTYNSSGFTCGTYGSSAYEMGSINFFNYDPQPQIFTTIGTVQSQGNYYYKVGENLTGDISINLSLDSDTKATIIVK